MTIMLQCRAMVVGVSYRTPTGAAPPPLTKHPVVGRTHHVAGIHVMLRPRAKIPAPSQPVRRTDLGALAPRKIFAGLSGNSAVWR